MNNPDPIVHLDDLSPKVRRFEPVEPDAEFYTKPKNYKQRLEEIPMLRACKETIESIVANHIFTTYKIATNHLRAEFADKTKYVEEWEWACSKARGIVENYIAELEYERNNISQKD